jgi:lambda family phage tail tape measure protein
MAADLSYDVRVNTRDAVNSVRGLQTAVVGLTSVFAARGVVQFADSITSLRNKLLTLTPDLNTVNKQFDALAAIAITSRAPLEATGDLFFRIQRSAKALGISTAEAAQITESLAKAMSASGLSAGEAAGPLLQLGQALQSGVFQGDELRSILEGMPVVAQALATELRVPVGALKELGSEGQISADVFVQAMRKAKDSIDEAFGRTTPTITSALEGLRTNSKLAFNEFEKNTQTGRNLAASIEYLGFMFFKATKNIDEFASTIGTVIKWAAIIASVTLLGRAIMFVVGTFSALGSMVVGVYKGIVAFGTWLGSLTGVATGVAGSLTVFGKALSTVAGIVSSLIANKLYEWFSDTYRAVSNFFDKLGSAGDSTSKAAEELAAYRAELAQMKEGLDDTAGASENAAALAEKLAKSYAIAALQMRTQTGQLEASLKQTEERLAVENQMMSLNKDKIQISSDEIEIAKRLTDIDIERRNAIQEIRDNLAKLNLEYSQLVKKDSEKGKELAGQIGLLQQQSTITNELYDKHSEGMARLIRNNQSLKLIEEDRKRTQENTTKALEDQFARQQQLNDILSGVGQQRLAVGRGGLAGDTAGLTGIQKQVREIAMAAEEAARSASAAFASQFDSEEGLTPERARELADGLNQINKAYLNLAGAQADFAIKNYESARSFDTGWNEAFARFKDNVTNVADQASNYFDKLTNGVADSFAKMAETGKWSFSDLKESFKSLANSMIADFIRIQVKRAILGSITGGGSFLGSLFGKANGGNVAGGVPITVGERGPELFVPRTAGTIVPNNGFMGGSAAQAAQPTQVTYNIQAVDASSFRSLVARDPSFLYAVTEKGRQSQPRARLA